MTTVTAVTGERRDIGASALERLRSSLRGELLSDGTPAYESARAVYNGMIDRRPALIARCADVADVIRSVALARDHALLVSVRGGGHNGPGLSVCEGGLMIDLSRMRGVRVDPEARTVRVGGGCVWGDVDHATHAFGLATVSGIISTTGVAGLTLGGGHGYLTRKYGLTIDNLLEADVVLADGSFVKANETQNADLFWALRGGGGNFGIVTSFLFRVHPVHTVVAGPMFWALDDAERVLRLYREAMPAAPENVYAFYAFLSVPPAPPFPAPLHGRTVAALMWCCLGSQEDAEVAIEPFRAEARPLFEHVAPMPYPALQSMFDALYPPGLRWYWKGDFVREIDDDAIALHVQHGAALPTPLSTMHLYPIDGAVNRVPKDATAFAFRDARWSEVIVGVGTDPRDDDRLVRWARAYWSDLHPHSAGGAYVNFMMEEGMDRVRATYRDNYDRLAAIKAKFDPQNLFRMNQNIEPSVGPS